MFTSTRRGAGVALSATVLGIGLLGSVGAGSAVAADGHLRCQGLVPTIVGNGGVVQGTSRRDVILLRKPSRGAGRRG